MSITDNINFKNEVLRSLNQMKKELMEQITNNNSKNENILKTIENKISNVSDKYQDSLAQQAIEIEKLKDFQTFKEKINSTLKTQDTRINEAKNQLNTMKIEYDKIFSSNLTVPGYIGPRCQYKSIGDYLNSNIEPINKMKNTYNNINKEVSDLKVKINNNLKHCTNLVVEFGIEQCQNFFNSKVNDYQKQLEFTINEITEKIMDIKASFVKLKSETEDSVNLIKQKIEIIDMVPSIKPDIENLINQKLEIVDEKIKNIDVKIETINEKINNMDTKCDNLRQQNYNELNEKITGNTSEINNIKEMIKDLKNNKYIINNKEDLVINDNNDKQINFENFIKRKSSVEKININENRNSIRTLSPIKNNKNRIKTEDIKVDIHNYINHDNMNKRLSDDIDIMKEIQSHNSYSTSNNVSFNNINDADNILNKNIIENDEKYMHTPNLLYKLKKGKNILPLENNKLIPNSSKKAQKNKYKNIINTENVQRTVSKKLITFSPDINNNKQKIINNNVSFFLNQNDKTCTNFSMTANKILLKDFYEKLKCQNLEKYSKNETNDPITNKTMKLLDDNLKYFMLQYAEIQKNRKIMENSNDGSESKLINNEYNGTKDFSYQTNLYSERSRNNNNILNYKNYTETSKARKLPIKSLKLKREKDDVVNNLYKNHYEKKMQKELKNKNFINGPMKLTHAFGRTAYIAFSPNFSNKSLSNK